MTGNDLRDARTAAGWTQARLAARLGVTQAYLSLMEAGKRRVPAALQRRLFGVLRLPPTSLPMRKVEPLDRETTDAVVEQGLARLGYPPLAYRATPGARLNPGELLLTALAADDLDARLTEALPWLLLQFDRHDTAALVARARELDLQNRLGFTAALARRVAERDPVYHHRRRDLEALEAMLERSRLAREDGYGRRETSPRMKEWLRSHRSEEARHWNLLSDLKAEQLPYGRANPRAVAEVPQGR